MTGKQALHLQARDWSETRKDMDLDFYFDISKLFYKSQTGQTADIIPCLSVYPSTCLAVIHAWCSCSFYPFETNILNNPNY